MMNIKNEESFVDKITLVHLGRQRESLGDWSNGMILDVTPEAKAPVDYLQTLKDEGSGSEID